MWLFGPKCLVLACGTVLRPLGRACCLLSANECHCLSVNLFFPAAVHCFIVVAGRIDFLVRGQPGFPAL